MEPMMANHSRVEIEMRPSSNLGRTPTMAVILLFSQQNCKPGLHLLKVPIAEECSITKAAR